MLTLALSTRKRSLGLRLSLGHFSSYTASLFATLTPNLYMLQHRYYFVIKRRILCETSTLTLWTWTLKCSLLMAVVWLSLRRLKFDYEGGRRRHKDIVEHVQLQQHSLCVLSPPSNLVVCSLFAHAQYIQHNTSKITRTKFEKGTSDKKSPPGPGIEGTGDAMLGVAWQPRR